MKTYRSKIDHWIWITIMAIIIGCQVIPFIFEPTTLDPILIIAMLSSILIPSLIVAHIYTSTYYNIDDDSHTLNVKSGVIYNYKYDINKITKIRHTRTWLSSPALSLDRIEITIGKYNKVVISPRDKAQFIRHLQSLNPSIIIER